MKEISISELYGLLHVAGWEPYNVMISTKKAVAHTPEYYLGWIYTTRYSSIHTGPA